MLRRLVLENFMSHKHTAIELAEGLTVLTGPNNCGKSAIVAALQTLADNPRGSGYVMRHGEKVARVTVETDDGHTVTWQRKKTPSYIIDNEEIHRVEPSQLSEVLRLGKVEIEPGKTKVEYDIHFGDQKSPIFLLNEPGSYAASFFASSSDATHLLSMQTLHRTRVKEKKAKAKVLTSETERVEAKLKKFEPVDDLHTNLQKAEQTFRQITEAVQRATAMTEIIDRIKTCETSKRINQRTLGHLSRLDEHDDTPAKLGTAVSAAENLCQTLQTLTKVTQDLSELTSIRQATGTLTAPPNLHDTPSLLQIARSLRQTTQRRHNLTAEASACETLKQPPELHDADSAAAIITTLKHTDASRKQLTSGAIVLGKLNEPPGLEPVEEANRHLTALRKSTHDRVVQDGTCTALKPLDAPPIPYEVGDIKQSIASLASITRRYTSIQDATRKLSKLEQPPTVQPPIEISETLGHLRAAKQHQNQQHKEAQEAGDRLKECFVQIKRFADENPKCETCGGTITVENVVSVAGHSHTGSDPSAGFGEST